ncbi:MAG: arylsulfatase A-like enzyme, partial [Planctomycetota bacterium]
YVYWTGTYQSQIQKDRGVPVSEVFISDVLKDAGYRTGFIGKWHLGVNERFRPHNRGFDEWFGFLPGLHDYFDWRAPENGGIWRNNEPAEGDTYLTDAFTGEAVDFITRNQDEPFFLYLAYNAVHSPIQVPEHYLQGIESPDPERRKMLGMVRAVDTGVGRILATLDDLKIADNTLVLFANDNGGATLSSNMPFQGSKATMWEGGSRVAMALRWPDQLESGSTFKRVVSTLDLFPTFAAAAGASLPAQRKIDGVDLMPFLTSDKKGQLHPALFWSLGEHGSSRAVREGPWKLVKQDYTLSLHNLIEDPSEQTDLKAQHPEIFTKLQRDWEAWNSEMVPPLWTTR